MGNKMLQLKNWLKTAAVEIRLRRNLFKEHQRKQYVTYGWNSKEYREYLNNLNDLNKLRWEYRHKHIAYSELRGKRRDQIEASFPYVDNPRNKPSEAWINQIKSEYIINQSCVAERLGGEF